MNRVRDILRSARRMLGASPMQRVMRELRRRGVDPGTLDAIELFGGTGMFHTLDYAPLVASLEIWEIDPERAGRLRRNLPQAKISITDSYRAVKNASKRYGLIVVDNPMAIEGEHAEHFDLFPDLFGIMADRAIMIINVIPGIEQSDLLRYPYLFNERHLAARGAFYGAPTLALPHLAQTYETLARGHGLTTAWHFFQKRHFVYYLVMMLEG